MEQTLTPDKLIAVDLDGTLLSPDLSVSPENLAAIRQAEAQGAVVAIVTGRSFPSAYRIAAHLGLLETPLVCFNGAVIRRPDTGETLYEQLVPAELAEEVVTLCAARHLHLNYYLGDEMYVSADDHWSRLYCERTGLECLPVDDLHQFDGRAPIKLLVVDAPEVIDRLLPELEQRFAGRLYITRSMAEYVEFLPLDASKGVALDWLAAHFEVPRERVMAAGDRLNDLPLLEHAGFPVAMPEADPPLRDAAVFIPSDQATGVAQGIAEFLRRVG
ncbi:MAG TPA: Cof-type HAD-IIB family hydrolase [Armatimonadota bacterium]|jgi:hypothetical protein